MAHGVHGEGCDAQGKRGLAHGWTVRCGRLAPWDSVTMDASLNGPKHGGIVVAIYCDTAQPSAFKERKDFIETFLVVW